MADIRRSHYLQRNTDGSTVNPAKLPTDPVSFKPSSVVAAPRLTFAAISVPDLGSRQPVDDPAAPSGTKGQPSLPSPGQAIDAVRHHSSSNTHRHMSA